MMPSYFPQSLFSGRRIWAGSCVLHIKEHLKDGGTPAELEKIRQSVFELSEFLVDILKIDQLKLL